MTANSRWDLIRRLRVNSCLNATCTSSVIWMGLSRTALCTSSKTYHLYPLLNYACYCGHVCVSLHQAILLTQFQTSQTIEFTVCSVQFPDSPDMNLSLRFNRSDMIEFQYTKQAVGIDFFVEYAKQSWPINMNLIFHSNWKLPNEPKARFAINREQIWIEKVFAPPLPPNLLS